MTLTINEIATMTEIEISNALRQMTRTELIAFCKANKIGDIKRLGGHLNAAFVWCKDVAAYASITLR